MLTWKNLNRKPYLRFLLIFSICTLSVGGALWACGGGELDDDYSVFAPEYFVSQEYSPFFFDSNKAFYDRGDAVEVADVVDSLMTAEWDIYLHHRLSTDAINFLLFQADSLTVDSARRYVTSGFKIPKPLIPSFEIKGARKEELRSFFDYLAMAKQCEKFATRPKDEGWDQPNKIVPDSLLSISLSKALDRTKDKFIKERLWFQLIRLQYFHDQTTTEADTLTEKQIDRSPITALFNKYNTTFSKNLIYYRAMGYLAGFHYRHKSFARANYLYSLCFANTSDLKIGSFWSFHPQEEYDWSKTLKMAENTEEQITLWQLLGISSDAARAIREIAKLNPRSDKMELLLSRLINIAEQRSTDITIDKDSVQYQPRFAFSNDATTAKAVELYNDSAYAAAYRLAYRRAVSASIANDRELALIDSLSGNKQIKKPYFWRLAAGYLHYRHQDYENAAKFYAIAGAEIPTGNEMILAQYKLLMVMLYAHQANFIDDDTETKLIEPLNWLANLRDKKVNIKNLRFENALTETITVLAKTYWKQRDKNKAIAFGYNQEFYGDYNAIEKQIQFITKVNKTPFENVMARYYPYKVEQLFYQQALLLTYQEKLSQAVLLMDKSAQDTKNAELLGNPFNNRLNDCHDCDHAAPQKKTYTRLTFLRTLKTIQTQLKSGKDIYHNALLMANAYYNINHYGNGRLFYEENMFWLNSSGFNDNYPPFNSLFTSQKTAAKYYKKALVNATNNEQRALCTFMLSKCARNEFYNDGNDQIKQEYFRSGNEYEHVLNYFRDLKTKFSSTRYYAEIIKECGDFNNYLNANR